MSERFGRTPYYSADQIDDVVESGIFRRHRDYLPYAYCLFMSQKDFEALDTGGGTADDFGSLRSEACGLIGPGPVMAPPGSGAYGDRFQGPSPGNFDPGDGGV